MVGGDLGGLIFEGFDLELETFEQERSQESKDLRVVECGGSRLRTPLGRSDATSGKSDIAEADFGKVRYGGGSELDSRSCSFFGGSSWWLEHVSSS